ncbi:hypothetical protein ACRB0I_005069 [Escherichia coli]|jgi:hypothetical protein|uniref:hypothetical protein n=1 Tax=Escherichia coli TaxID=562 RepID=UPI001F4473FA|nr:hypothetical protein [Escherichia coli]MCF3276882.1 hypothetical protein [Escherichia coli]
MNGQFTHRWKRVNQHVGMCCFSYILIVIATSFSLRAETKYMDSVKYLFSFKTTRSGCMFKINGFPITNNFNYNSGTITTGGSLTAFANNGLNKVELMMGPIDPDDNSTLYNDSSCKLVITKDTLNTSQLVTDITLSVDKDNKIVASSSYNGVQKGNGINEEQSPEDTKLNWHRFSRNINLSDLPEWLWMKASPVTNKDLPLIKNMYQKIWASMRIRDIPALKEMAVISSKEIGEAEGVTPEIIFDSYGLPQVMSDTSLSVVGLEWEKYKLVTYCDSRVFRLAFGVYQHSPLKFKDQSGNVRFTYSPYFSIIDGKVILVR